MSKRKLWSREELLLVMNLYCRIPFGRQHSHANEVITLANILGRSASSVAMKLNNFTSLDPNETSRGIKGLSGTSKLDKQIWQEFHENWEKLAIESEEIWINKIEIITKDNFSQKTINRESQQNSFSNGNKEWAGLTEGERVMNVRYAQNFFRRAVLTAYSERCCISNIPIPALLVASHILPWKRFPETRTNPRNGLCLSNLHDAAFDKGFITFDEERCLILSKELKEYLPNDSLYHNFIRYVGKPIHLPDKFSPDEEFLKYHREEIFKG